MNNTTNFATHEEIYAMMLKLFNAHANFKRMHNRENLDDLIADLSQYRDTLPAISDYIEHNLL